jgi:hypothetical protein
MLYRLLLVVHVGLPIASHELDKAMDQTYSWNGQKYATGNIIRMALQVNVHKLSHEDVK